MISRSYRRLAVALFSMALVAAPLAYAHKGGDSDESDGRGPSAAPEIDPAFVGAGAALVGGTFAILRDRRRKRQ